MAEPVATDDIDLDAWVPALPEGSVAGGPRDTTPSATAPQIAVRPPIAPPSDEGWVPTGGPQDVPLRRPTVDPPAPAGNWIERATTAGKDIFTGESKIPPGMENTPELSSGDARARAGASVDAGVEIAGAYFLGGSPRDVADIAVKAMPGAKVGQDAKGNVTVTLGDQTFYVNKPGMTAADIISGLGTAGMLYPGARAIGGIKALGGATFLNTAVRSAAQGVAGFGTDLLRQVTLHLQGSEQPTDYGTAAETGVGAALGEPVAATVAAAARAVGRFAGRFAGQVNMLAKDWETAAAGGGAGAPAAPGGASVVVAADAPLRAELLNESGKKFLRNAGVADADMGQYTVADVQRAMESIPHVQRGMVLADTKEAKETARRILLQSSERVPLTLGGMTGNASQRSVEDRLRNTGTGERKELWTQFQQNQDDARRAAQERRLFNPPGQAPLNEAEAGQKLAEAAKANQARMRGETRGAYDKLGASTAGGMDALPLHEQLVFGPNASADLVARLSDTARKYPFLGDNTRAALDEATRLATGRAVQPGGKLLPDAIKDISPDATHFNLGAYNEARMRLNRIYGRADNEQDRAVIRQVIADLDDSVQAAHTAGNVVGDPALLGTMKDAVAKSREEFKTFKPESKEARAFVDTVTKEGVTGQKVIDDLYGAGAVGNKADTAQILDHFDKLYPAGSEARDVAKQAAARRIIFGSKEETLSGSNMSPFNVAQRISDAVNPTGRGREISEKLFSQDEIASLLRLRDMMGPLHEQARMNPSGTAYRLADMVKTWANGVPGLAKMFGQEVRAISASRRALSGGLPLYTPRTSDMPLGAFRTTVPAVAGGVAGQQDAVVPTARAGATGLLSVPIARSLVGR